ncbi:MAG: AAA family ATPase [Myxococcales bacterium]|nr:AAA family ATPase [Myxococcales bacterium]
MVEAELRGTPRFEVARRLGAGGMGIVYRAIDRTTGAAVALKTLRALDGEALFRFKREFRALRDIHHPNLVTLGELHEADGRWFFTMELVEGDDLLSWVWRRPADALADSDTVRAAPAELAAVGSGGVRAAPELDEARLREALAGIARGLAALHAAGKIHRDIKPGNIRVDPGGRPVILDFGLVEETHDRVDRASDANVVGTVGYMAPEQAAGWPVDAAADWYALGCVLFEALTGRLPHVGPALQVLMAKQVTPAPPVAALAPGAAPDLAELCARLLAIDPGERAGADEVLAVAERRPVTPAATPGGSGAVRFVGRRRELDALDAGLAFVAEGRPARVVVRGPSGVGKSALVTRWLRSVEARGLAEIVHGRCSEHESVPFKTLDGVIDGVARLLARLPFAEAAAVAGARPAVLAQAFPVLLGVEAIARAPRDGGAPRDPLEQRVALGESLRDLFARLARRRPLIVAIDDLQWADGDGLQLLAAALAAPAPPLLLVVTVRDDLAAAAGAGGDAGPRPDALAVLPASAAWSDELALAPLPAADALVLARSLVGDDAAAAVVASSGGHPLLLAELARHVAARGEGAPAQLEEAIAARVLALPPLAREVLELCALAEVPLAPALLAGIELAGAPAAGERARIVNLLRAGHLVRSSAARAGVAVEPYHDRIREVVAAGLDPARRRDAHRRLAGALERAPRRETEALFRHHDAAGDRAAAGRYAHLAAEEAAAVLAFARAASLFGAALERLPDDDATTRRALLARRATMRALAGYGGPAADDYVAAAALPGHEPTALELRRLATEQLLRAGHLERGLALLREVAGELGLSMARSRAGAAAGFLWRRARLRLRGLGFTEREAAAIAPDALRRVDVCWSLAAALAIVDTFHAAAFQSQHLLAALSAGEPGRVARALAMEGAFRSITGARGRAAAIPIAARAQALAERSASPPIIGAVHLVRALIVHQGGAWQESLDACRAGERTLREQCVGASLELSTTRALALWNLAYLGDLHELGRSFDALAAEARERGDVYTAVSRAGYPSLVFLARDQPARVREDVAEIRALWGPRPYTMQAYYEVLALAHADLYEGDAVAAARRFDEALPAMRRELVLRIEHARVAVEHLRARVAIARAGAEPAHARRLLARAERAERWVVATGMPWAVATGMMGQAGVAAARGEVALAASRFAEAAVVADGAGMRLHAAIARLRAGELRGATAVAEAARERIRDLGGREPARLAAVLAPLGTALALTPA